MLLIVIIIPSPGFVHILPISILAWIRPNTSYYHYYRSNGLVRSPGGYLGEDIDVLYDFIHSGKEENRARNNNVFMLVTILDLLTTFPLQFHTIFFPYLLTSYAIFAM